jgi:hypothetical protein
MKRLLLLFLICLYPAMVFSHPGKTDKYGGHKCLKGCEEWGLFYGEYHLHDKDGKPIHISRKKKTPEAPEPAEIRSAATETVVPMPADIPQTRTVTVNRYVTNVYEENIFSSNPLLWAVLVLLLLLLILRRNRKQSENP